MRYVIGVDGGQTSTTAVIVDETGCLLGVGYGGPANHIHELGGPERTRRALSDALRGAIAMADLQNAHIAGACLSLTDGSETMYDVCMPVVPTDRLRFGQATRIALYSITFGRPGVAVIAGTGAAAYGQNAAGEQASSSGWGYILGDEGSSYWIALRALSACCRAQDGIAPPTQLLPLLLQQLHATDMKPVQKRIYSGALIRPEIAALAEVVSRAAAQGDDTARRILRDAGRELALAANACLVKLRMECGPVPVGTVGGVFRAGRLVLRTFREVVKRVAPEAVIVPARVPAAVAAALMALEDLGIPPHDALLARVEATLPRLGPIKT